jgi:DNA-binding NarL/FixJ family response regulator
MTGDRPVRLFLVDDQELVRAGFRMVLDAQPDMTVVGEAGDGLAGVEGVATTRPDVVLMDIRMPRLDGVEATRRIQGVDDPPKVLVLTTFDLDEYAFAALKAGAAGFLLKDAGPAELLAAIRAVHAGDAAMAPSTTRRMLERFVPQLPDAGLELAQAAERRAAAARLAPLTEREREVLEAVGRGLTNSEIAAGLFLAEATVKTHIGRVLHKLDLRDRVQMVITAYETGLVGRPS